MATTMEEVHVGDKVSAKIKIKNKTKKVEGTIKWIGEGKFLPGPGVYYRIDIAGKRNFVQRKDIVSILSAASLGVSKPIKRRSSKSSKDAKNKKKKKKKNPKLQWINIHFVGCPDVTKKSQLNKQYISLKGASTYETIAPTPLPIGVLSPGGVRPLLSDEVEDEKDDAKDDYKEIESTPETDTNQVNQAINSNTVPPPFDVNTEYDPNASLEMSSLGGMQGMNRGRSQSGPISTAVLSQIIPVPIPVPPSQVAPMEHTQNTILNVPVDTAPIPTGGDPTPITPSPMTATSPSSSSSNSSSSSSSSSPVPTPIQGPPSRAPPALIGAVPNPVSMLDEPSIPSPLSDAGAPTTVPLNTTSESILAPTSLSSVAVPGGVQTLPTVTAEDGKEEEKDDHKKAESVELDFAALMSIGGMKAMDRGRSQSGPVPSIEKIQKKPSVNEIYSLRGVESQSIRIRVNPQKFTVLKLKNHLYAKFQIPRTSDILLTFHNWMLTIEHESIDYYGIQNHSCLLLCISEKMKRKKKLKPKAQTKRAQTQRRMRLYSRLQVGAPGGQRRRASAARRRRTLHGRSSSHLPISAGGGPPGISGIESTRSAPKSSNGLNVPESNGLSLAQSKSDTVDGGLVTDGLYSILKDRSKTIQKRVSQFCKEFAIERVTDLDIYTYDLDSNCISMGCGHGMPKETLFAYAESQLKDGQISLKCPHLKNPDESNDLCKRPWPMQAVRKVLLSGESPKIPLSIHDTPSLTNSIPNWEGSLFGLIIFGFMRSHGLQRFASSVLLLMYQYALNKKQETVMRRPDVKRMMGLEIECAKNKFIDTYDYQKCPNCSLFIYRSKVAMSKVKLKSCCPLCNTQFCWKCSESWKTVDLNGEQASYCGNSNCDVSMLSILQTCPRKRINMDGIPTVRACPKCNELIFHVTACKHMDCRSCKTKFCFCCLKLYTNGAWQCGNYSAPCPDGVAPRQTIDSMPNSNRGNVVLFQLQAEAWR